MLLSAVRTPTNASFCFVGSEGPVILERISEMLKLIGKRGFQSLSSVGHLSKAFRKLLIKDKIKSIDTFKKLSSLISTRLISRQK